MKRILLAAVVIVLWSQASLSATDMATDARLRNIEERLNLLDDRENFLNENLHKSMSVSGYADAAFTVDSRKDVNPSFQMRHLSLFFTQDINESWHFFSEIEFENAPQFEAGTPMTVWNCGPDNICGGAGAADDTQTTINTLSTSQGTIFTEAVNMNLKWRPTVNFRIGRFFTPAGIWLIDHYPPFVATQIRPKHIRKIFPQTTDGLMLYGITSVMKHFISYDFYIGNGEGNTASADMNTNKASGLRLEMDLPFFHETTIGGSFYKAVQNDGTDKTAAGLHAKIRDAGYEIQTEYADASLKPTAGSSYHRRGYYIQGQYRIRNWSIGLRHDFYNPDTNLDTAETTRSVFGSYYINQDMNIKLEHHIVHLADPTSDDYNMTLLSLNANLGN